MEKHQDPEAAETVQTTEPEAVASVAICSPLASDTPETDAEMRQSWGWDVQAMDYRPAGVVVGLAFARKLERERDEARMADSSKCQRINIARQTIKDQSDRIAWLESQWEETKRLLHAVGAGRADSRLRRNVEEALMHLETNYDIDGASMKDSDAARKLRSAISQENTELTHPETKP